MMSFAPETDVQPILRSAEPPPTLPLHTLTWSVWLLAAFLPALLTKNPVYLLTLLVAVGLVYYAFGRPNPHGQSWLVFLKIGAVLTIFNVVFSLISVNAGRTVLVELPEWVWLAPGSQTTILLRLGGPITLEVVSYSLATSLGLLAMLLVFATFNSVVDHYQLLRYIPGFLAQTSVILSIAITFVPQLIVAAREIREAQVLRGHRFRGVRDWLPLFVVILSEGLERALTLAESMEARGFGGQMPTQAGRREVWLKSAFIFDLLVLIVGTLLLLVRGGRPWGLGVIGLGLAALAATFWLVGRSVNRSRYRRALWRAQDTLVTITGGLIVAVWLAFYFIGRRALVFYPYPEFRWPEVNLMLLGSLLLLAMPTLLTLARPEPKAEA